MSTVVDTAADDLLEVLADGPLERGVALERMTDLDHPVTRVDLARRQLGVRTIRTGAIGSHQRFEWELPVACPACHRPYRDDVGTDDGPGWADDSDIEEPYPETASAIEPPSVAPAAPSWRSPDGPSTCVLCGRTWMLPPATKCMTFRCEGWTE